MWKLEDLEKQIKKAKGNGYTHVPDNFFGVNSISFVKSSYSEPKRNFYINILEYTGHEDILQEPTFIAKIRVKVNHIDYEINKEGQIVECFDLTPIDNLPHWYKNNPNFSENFYDDFKQAKLDDLFSDEW